MNLKNSVYKVTQKKFSKEIEIPSSKSYANRALILGALIGNDFKISNLTSATDVENLVSSLEKIGLKLKRDKNEIIFLNSFPDCEINIDIPLELNTGDGGTTNRFLIALLSLGKREYILNPTEKMSDRPIEDLLKPLRALGVNLDLGSSNYWLKLKGPIKIIPDVLEIDSSKSTQFASALKLIFFKHNTKFILTNVNSSDAYLLMTDSIISNVLVKNNFIIPVDFSSMSYPIAQALILGSVLIKNCHELDVFQADSVFIEILKKSGADIEFTSKGLRVSNSKTLLPFEVNGSSCPDLVMTLVFLASKIQGTSIITNLEVLKYKESDRLHGILEILKKFNVDYLFNELNYSLEIKGSSKISSVDFIETARDHRMVMMAYLFLKTNSGGDLSHTECIDKSFPEFLSVMD